MKEALAREKQNMLFKANKIIATFLAVFIAIYYFFTDRKTMRTVPDNLYDPHTNDHQSGFSLLKNNVIALLALIIVTCLVTFWVWAEPAIREAKYVYLAPRVEEGELYRFLSAGFLHKNKAHLQNNMLGLFINGLIVGYRTKMSNIKFALFYLSGIIFASYFNHRYHMSYLRASQILGALGASGGVYAVRFACLMLMFSPGDLKNGKQHIQVLSIALFCYFFAQVYNDFSSSDVYDRVFSFRTDDIAHEAHFGAALYGIAFALFFYPKQVFAGVFASEPDTPEAPEDSADSGERLLFPFDDDTASSEDTEEDFLFF